jgi:NTP pyrophosphatase (non-canonical NTP hydrolase)
MADLQSIWEEQREYNRKLREDQHREPSAWVTHHAMGLQEEIFEMLREVDWKFHRAPRAMTSASVPWELADITKYVMSLWQDFGIDLEEALGWVALKTGYLAQIHYQEHFHVLQPSVLILDLDGVVADFRGGFLRWLQESGVDLEFPAGGSSIHMDIAAGWNTSQYEKLKTTFEMRTEGYLSLPPYNTLNAVGNLTGISIIVHTARPRNSKVVSDTWRWIQRHGLELDELHIGSSVARIEHAERLLQQGHNVLLVDDDPTLLERARSIQGLRILRASQSYNGSVGLPSFRPDDSPADILETLSAYL